MTSSGNPWAAISLNTSTDGGKSWGDPVAAVSKSGFYHLLDKPWSTIDPSNHKRIFVSYTDFDGSQTNGCGTNFPGRTAIEFVESDDGGVTWSTHSHRGHPGLRRRWGAGIANGSQFHRHALHLVGEPGQQLPAWPTQHPGLQLLGRNSVEPGDRRRFGSAGWRFLLPAGEFRDFLDMSMAIDHSGTATDGALYITWADGRNKTVPDPLATQGFYAYDDVLLRASFDGGITWGFVPTKVNSDTQSRLGLGHDHYQSGIAVDKPRLRRRLLV